MPGSDSETYGFQPEPRRHQKVEEEPKSTSLTRRDAVSLKDYEGLAVRIKEFTVTDKSNQNWNRRLYDLWNSENALSPSPHRCGHEAKLSYSSRAGQTYTVIGGVSLCGFL